MNQRERAERLQVHVEAALLQPSMKLDEPSIVWAEIARQLRVIIADDVTDDEIVLAAYRVRAKWRGYRHPGARSHLATIEANCASLPRPGLN
jgi:hypothetical protein